MGEEVVEVRHIWQTENTKHVITLKQSEWIFAYVGVESPVTGRGRGQEPLLIKTAIDR